MIPGITNDTWYLVPGTDPAAGLGPNTTSDLTKPQTGISALNGVDLEQCIISS